MGISPLYSIHQYSEEIYKVVAFKGVRDPDNLRVRDKENEQHYDAKLNEAFCRAKSLVLQYALCNPCEHAWTETSSTAPTCTLSGSRLLTCSKCQQTKKEAIPALGHDWQVKQSVTTEYDETGQLTQQGYTIYECSRCHEQYKAPSGTSPPVNPMDPDISGDGVFSGIFSLLLDFLGFFFKTFKDFTKSGVKAFLQALQDGTGDIFGLLNPFDWSA